MEQSRACSMPTAAKRCGRRRAARRTSRSSSAISAKAPGKVDGAFAELPRYFADADRVMDVETRMLWCMEKLQGFKRADLVKRPHPGGGQPVKELGAIATYVASKSSGMKYRGQARQAAGEGGGGRSATPSSSGVRARSISPARPATPMPASASGCRGCRILADPKEARQGRRRMAGLSRVDHARDDDAAPPVRLLLADADAASWSWAPMSSVALIAYLTKTGRGRRDRRPRPEALSGGRAS